MATKSSRKTLHVYSDVFPEVPADNEMRGATIFRILFREAPPRMEKSFEDPANAPSEEITLACAISGRWGVPTKRPDNRLELPQELYLVDGWGYSNVMEGPIQITLNAKKKSMGTTVEKTAGTAFPADSHFDLYIQVAMPNNASIPVLENADPIRIVCSDVKRLPPLGSPFLHNGSPVALRDRAGVVRAWAFQGKKNLVQLVKQSIHPRARR